MAWSLYCGQRACTDPVQEWPERPLNDEVDYAMRGHDLREHDGKEQEWSLTAPEACATCCPSCGACDACDCAAKARALAMDEENAKRDHWQERSE